jgi:hypothetical protein
LKKRSDKPTALAPPLQPFLKPTANREALRSHEVEDVLYNFLSPDLAVALTSETGDVHVHTLPTQPLLPLPPSSSFTTGSSNGHNLIVKTERISEISEQESLRSPRQRPAQDNNSSQLTAGEGTKLLLIVYNGFKTYDRYSGTRGRCEAGGASFGFALVSHTAAGVVQEEGASELLTKGS